MYRQYEEQGAAFVPSYLELLRRGGRESPESLGRVVGVDLGDPEFWTGGLLIIEEQLEAAEQAAKDAGKLRQEGKEYVIKDGDVLHFKFNV